MAGDGGEASALAYPRKRIGKYTSAPKGPYPKVAEVYFPILSQGMLIEEREECITPILSSLAQFPNA